ncbi:MAG TPA: hypothetical protein VGS11_07170 [Candidatus Bathyarchaeia archaeon]|nr:hypothetical protein [Candidatus Bathyarchaeia archaeon]
MPLLASGIEQYAILKGAGDTFNETLTQFWIRIVNHAIQADPTHQEFEHFLTTFPALLNKQLPYLHWRRETLVSPSARSHWMKPDLRPLPF